MTGRQGFRRVYFDEIAESITLRVDDPSSAGVERYVGLEHLDPNSLEIARWGVPTDVEATKLRFLPGDIIFGRRRAYQRKLAVADFEGICSAHALVLRAKPSVMLPKFLPFFMQSETFYERAIAISVGSLSPTINWKTLREQEFDIPPIEEQHEMADLLWGVERERQVAGRLSRALDVARAALMVRFLANGDNEQRMLSVKDIVLAGPKNGFSARSNDQGRGVKTLAIGAVTRGQVITEGSTKFAEVDPAVASAFTLDANDVLVVRGNGNKRLTGRAGLVAETLPGFIYPDLLIKLRFNPTIIDPRYATLAWNLPHVHSALLRRAKSTNGIWKVNGKDIKQHRLPVPSLESQERILDLMADFDQASVSVVSHVSQLVSLRESILAEGLGYA